MSLWRKAAGSLKDKNSIWLAALSNRRPEIETAVIRATSHDALHIDYKNTRRVFQWLRTSPSAMKPILSAITWRVHRTRSWAVALKSLILVHCLLAADTAVSRQIGRLPFDLSDFSDRHERSKRGSCYTSFVRLYFVFLDHRAAYFSSESGKGSSWEDLLRVQKWQTLLDMVVKIRPPGDGVVGEPVREAMDCIIMEVFELYAGICAGIAGVVPGIVGKLEAEMTLRVVKKAVLQSEKLGLYFKWCREMGFLSSSQYPTMEKISEVDVRELERVISGVSDDDVVENKGLETVVTDVWEVFDEDLSSEETTPEDSLNVKRELPDLITF